jgi:hypothetical protein
MGFWLVVSKIWKIFHFIYEIYNPSHWRTHIFQDGWNHQPDKIQ